MEAKEEAHAPRRYVEWCAISGGICQKDLAKRAGVSQMTISRVIRSLRVATQTEFSALMALNEIRAERGMHTLVHDDVLWTR
jgi:predicted transcriptional regulator